MKKEPGRAVRGIGDEGYREKEKDTIRQGQGGDGGQGGGGGDDEQDEGEG